MGERALIERERSIKKELVVSTGDVGLPVTGLYVSPSQIRGHL